MLGVPLIAMAVATAVLVALAFRLSGLVSTLLVTYLAYVTNLALVVLVLSPFREVTRGGLAVAETVLLVAAAAAWWLRGRPGPPLATARAAAREIVTDPVTLLFLAAVLVLLGYEALLASSPPNNGDSLTYHLSKAAAWAQHGGWYWIQDAPEVEMTAYQPLAEQQILFLFAVTKNGVLYALPQYLAALAALVAVYGSARRLGYGVRASACASFMLATFSVFALESFTAQNDLFGAAFVAIATCMLLGRGRLEPALAGFAMGLGVGTKLTVGVTVPIVACLALALGRRVLAWSVVGGIVGFVSIGMWGYVMNRHVTGHWFGVGTADVQNRASPHYPESLRNAFMLAYGLMDGSILSSRLIHALALVGIAVGVGVGAWSLWRHERRRALRDGTLSGLAFIAPLLVIGGASAVAWLSDRWGLPIRGEDGFLLPYTLDLNQEYGRIANENYSAYGPVGIVALLAAIGLTLWDYGRRRVGVRHLVLALALPVFLTLVALTTFWVPFLIRYFLLPAVIATPLLARLFRSRVVMAAFAVAACIAIGLTITHDQPKPLNNPYGLGRPWNLTQATALYTNSAGKASGALDAFNRAVPRNACVGAVLGPNEPAYLLYGRYHKRKVVYLSPNDTVNAALSHGLWHVVITQLTELTALADDFRNAGWDVQKLDDYWWLASYPKAGDAAC